MPEITQDELDRLRALQPATVTIEASEYQRLKAAANGIDPELHQRLVRRLAEVEQLLRVEMTEHASEVATWKKGQ